MAKSSALVNLKTVAPNFGNIVGHQRQISTLIEVASSNRLHHALLFEGPRGVGKYSVALRLAMMVNCTSSNRPCGECDSCRLVASGNHPDIIILEPEPERAKPIISVKQVRQVIKTVSLHRYAAKRRFVIIDPASAMADPAANALLKTLEEPPDETGFILIATHASELLPTIVSRCQRVRFGAVDIDAVAFWLSEQGVADPDTLARLSLGCPGVALELASGDMKKRQKLRTELLTSVTLPAPDLFKWTQKITKGPRTSWRPTLERMIELMEELLRDAVAIQSEANTLIHHDIEPTVRVISDRLWPHGITAMASAIETSKKQLNQYVAGRIIADALLARFQAELGDAPL